MGETYIPGLNTETGEVLAPIQQFAQPVGLVNKLAAIRRELRNIEKRGVNAFHKYKFMRAEDVAGDIGDALAERNIIISRVNGKCQMTPVVSGDGKSNFMCVVECTYIFVDGDSGQELHVWACGAGIDTGDKGPYKALTGAFKYALTQALCMRVGDDPEANERSRPPSVLRPVPTPAGRPATEAQIKQIEARCKLANTDIADVRAHFNVSSLAELTEAQVDTFNSIMDRTQK